MKFANDTKLEEVINLEEDWNRTEWLRGLEAQGDIYQ